MGEKRSVLQRMRERTSDVDAAVGAMSRGEKPPKIGGATRPGKPGTGGGGGPAPRVVRSTPSAAQPPREKGRAIGRKLPPKR